jgi:hypothetical protein
VIDRAALIAAVRTWPGEEIRIEFRPYRGQTYVHVKRWHLESGAWIPRAGFGVSVRHLPALAAALAAAEAVAREEGAVP